MGGAQRESSKGVKGSQREFKDNSEILQRDSKRVQKESEGGKEIHLWQSWPKHLGSQRESSKGVKGSQREFQRSSKGVQREFRDTSKGVQKESEGGKEIHLWQWWPKRFGAQRESKRA